VKEHSLKALLLSSIAIAASVGIFLMLVNYFRDMINLTSGMRAYGNLSLIIGLGLAELAFIYLIGSHLNTCAAKGKLLRCFSSVSAALAGTYSLVFFLRYMTLVRILGYKLSVETIQTIPMGNLLWFFLSVVVTSVCISIRSTGAIAAASHTG